MPIRLPLLFHFNQTLNEVAGLASRVCYRGLLRVLLDAPVRANIHISGTLIQALKWLDPEPLELIRAGIENGQFELLASTHAQNIPYASEDWDNQAQVEEHLEILEKTFGVRPLGFWNSERCWRQTLVPLIAGAGFRWVTIEDHILDAAGALRPVISSTGYGGDRLFVVRDDEALKHQFNYSAWFGRPERLHAYLDTCLSEWPGLDQVRAYAEDAEAMGLWGHQMGVSPGQTMARLADLLAEIAARKDVETVLFRELPTPELDIPAIPDGSAAWMDASLRKPGRPYHEDGYASWFDFNSRSPKLAFFRTFYSRIRSRLQAAASESEASGLYRLARHAYLTHQYEFGCIGIGGEEARVWRGAETALTLLALDAAQASSQVTDANLDGVPELLLANTALKAVVSPIGGRLLYLADAGSGQLIVGTPSSVVMGQYRGESYPAAARSVPAPWIPGQIPGDTQVAFEDPPTRLARFLPDWIWQADSSPVALEVWREPDGDRPMVSLRTAQQGCFCDEVRAGGDLLFKRDTGMALSEQGFLAELPGGINFGKRFRLEGDDLVAAYSFTCPSNRRLDLRTACEISGDYAAILDHGRNAVGFETGARGPAVVCRMRRERYRLAPGIPPADVAHFESMLALTIELRFDLDLAAGKAFEFEIRISRERIVSDGDERN